MSWKEKCGSRCVATNRSWFILRDSNYALLSLDFILEENSCKKEKMKKTKTESKRDIAYEDCFLQHLTNNFLAPKLHRQRENLFPYDYQ